MNVSVDVTKMDSKSVLNAKSSTPKIQKITQLQIRDRILQSKKDTFIAAFKVLRSNISLAAEKIGISRQTYYEWLETDQNFAMDILNAQEMVTDQVRANLIEEAADNHDMTAIIFYLKHKDPSFKEERNQVNVQVNNNSGELADAIKAIAAKMI